MFEIAMLTILFYASISQLLPGDSSAGERPTGRAETGRRQDLPKRAHAGDKANTRRFKRPRRGLDYARMA
jgi:hypothetical protein